MTPAPDFRERAHTLALARIRDRAACVDSLHRVVPAEVKAERSRAASGLGDPATVTTGEAALAALRAEAAALAPWVEGHRRRHNPWRHVIARTARAESAERHQRLFR